MWVVAEHSSSYSFQTETCHHFSEVLISRAVTRKLGAEPYHSMIYHLQVWVFVFLRGADRDLNSKISRFLLYEVPMLMGHYWLSSVSVLPCFPLPNVLVKVGSQQQLPNKVCLMLLCFAVRAVLTLSLQARKRWSSSPSLGQASPSIHKL